MSQGRRIAANIVDRIIQLLRETDLQMPVIAQRMGVDDKTVGLINRRHKVRLYNGRRLEWTVNE